LGVHYTAHTHPAYFLRLAQLPWRARLRYLADYALPSPTYMRWRYHLASPLGLPLAYLRRWFTGARALLRTLRLAAKSQRPRHDSQD